MMAARRIETKGDIERHTEKGVQAILDFLEIAATDLERATSGQEATRPHRETIFPTKAMALEAIEKLPLDETVGFQISRDGEGRCSVRIWFAGRSG